MKHRIQILQVSLRLRKLLIGKIIVFLYGKEANVEKEKIKPVARRKKISQIESSDFVLNLVQTLTPLKDDYHREILQRITGENRDLVNLQAKYHRGCYHLLTN